MKKKYRFIQFAAVPTGEWDCLNNSTNYALGTVAFYGPWKRWVFIAANDACVFSADCLQDIAHFMGQLPKP